MARPAYDEAARLEIEARIRQTAADLFAKHGYRSVSLRSIAQSLGWSAPALYRYYDSKEALLAAIRAEGFLEIRDMLRAVRDAAATPMEAVAQAMQAYVHYAQTRTEMYRLMYELDQGDVANVDSVYANRKEAFGEAVAMAQAVLDAGLAQGDALELAHLFWINAHGLAALAVANQLDLGCRCEDLVEPMLATLLRGLSKGE